MLDKKQVAAHRAALAAAGLSPGPKNTSVAGEKTTEPRPQRTLEKTAKSSDKRLAAAAKKRLKELENAAVNPESLELPPETRPLDEQTVEERAANAGDMAAGLPDDYEYRG